MNEEMDEILKRMGWTSGLHLPAANDENKALQQEVENLMLKKVKATALFRNEENRHKQLDKHLKFVNEQSQDNQKLLSVYKQQLDSENHKYRLVTSERDRTQQEIRHLQKNFEDVESRINSKKADFERAAKKMEKIRAESSWDEEALEAWDESLKRRDGDNELLKQLSREDEHRANELEARRKNLQMEVVKRQESVHKMASDVMNYESILERTAKVFKQQRAERTALIKQWQEAVKSLRLRDAAIQKVAQETTELQEVLYKKQEKLDEKIKFFEHEEDNNKEVQFQIDVSNSNASRLGRELNEFIQYVQTLGSDANTLKRTLIATAKGLEQERIKGRNTLMEITQKEDRMWKLKTEVANLEQKLDEVLNTSMTVSEKTNQLEQFLHDEKRQEKALIQDIERMQGLSFRTQQTLNALKDEMKLKELEIKGTETSTAVLRKEVKNSNNELSKQREIIYNLDYQINQLESKLATMEGTINDNDEKQSLLEKLKDLEQEAKETYEVQSFLENQVKGVHDEMRRLTTLLQADQDHLARLQSQLDDQTLLFEGGTKQFNLKKQITQDLQVSENLLRLRTNQLDNIMKDEDSSIYSLQKFRTELDVAMRERQIEINTSKEMLAAKLRILDEEKGRLKCDIMGRRTKIEQLQKRHSIAVLSLGSDEDGNPLSVTHFKILNAQEKYMLQQQGDELDMKVKKAEQEIVAMENTLQMINQANFAFKQNLSAIRDEDAEVEELKGLDERVKEAENALNYRKFQLAKTQRRIKDLKSTFEEQEKTKLEILKIYNDRQDEFNAVQDKIEDMYGKMSRADRQLKNALQKIGDADIEKYRKNVKIRQFQEGIKDAMQQLQVIYNDYTEMSPLIKRYMAEYGLQLRPTRLTPSTSSDSVLTASSHESPSVGVNVAQVNLTFNATSQPRSKTQQRGRRKP